VRNFCKVNGWVNVHEKYKVVIHKAEEGGYWAEVPALPGCFSQGETLEEVRANIKEAIEAYIESQEKDLLELKKTDRVITVDV